MNRGLWNASLALVILGIISLWAGVIISFYEKERRALKGKTTGRIVDLVMKEGEGPYRNKYYPVVEYYAEGKLYKVISLTGAYPSRWEIGQKIPLLYDPADPEMIREDSRPVLIRHLSALFYGAGIIMLLAGIYTFIRFAVRG